MTIDALICKIYIPIVLSDICYFVLKAAFHFGSFMYGSVSGMRPLYAVSNGADNSNQFSFILRFPSHSLLTYICLLFRCTFSFVYIFIKEFSCNVSQTY